MNTRLTIAALAASLAAAPPALAQTAPPCGPMAAAVYEPGCEGPGRLVCDTGASLPAGSEWCACDGRTVSSASMAPPAGLRYRFRGACEVPARFELTDERSAAGARTGRVVVFLAVGGGSAEAARVAGPCRPQPARAGELARVACGPRGATALALRRDGDAVTARDGARELARIAVPAAQRVSGATARRF